MQLDRNLERDLSKQSVALKWLRMVLVVFTGVAVLDYAVTHVVDSLWLYTACGLIGAFGLAVGTKLWRPARPSGWYLMSAGIFVFVIGDIVYLLMSRHGTPAYPGFADLFYLAGYPFLGWGLAHLAKDRSANRGNLIDALIVSTSAGLAAWTFLVKPFALDATLSVGARLVSIAYPLGDLVLLTVVCWFFTASRGRSRSLLWLGAAMAALIVSDVLYGVASLAGTYVGGWQDAGYIISYVALAVAALHPSMRSVGREDRTSGPRLSSKRLLTLAAAAMIGPGLLFASVGDASTTQLDLRVMAGGSLLLFLLSLARMGGLIRAIDRNSDLLTCQREELSTLVAQLQAMEDQRRQLLEALVTASERERSALAMDLHDGPIQRLTVVGFDLELALISLETADIGGSTAKLQEVIQSVTEQIASLRDLMVSLRPPALDERGLASALTDLVDGLRKDSGLTCEVDVDPVRISSELETLLYRIAQEAVANIRKHSHALKMSLRLVQTEEGLELEIGDDGIGSDASDLSQAIQNGHVGLASIAERLVLAGGTFDFDSSPGRGTRLRITFGRTSMGSEVPDAFIAHR